MYKYCISIGNIIIYINIYAHVQNVVSQHSGEFYKKLPTTVNILKYYLF